MAICTKIKMHGRDAEITKELKCSIGDAAMMMGLNQKHNITTLKDIENAIYNFSSKRRSKSELKSTARRQTYCLIDEKNDKTTVRFHFDKTNICGAALNCEEDACENVHVLSKYNGHFATMDDQLNNQDPSKTAVQDVSLHEKFHIFKTSIPELIVMTILKLLPISKRGGGIKGKELEWGTFVSTLDKIHGEENKSKSCSAETFVDFIEKTGRIKNYFRVNTTDGIVTILMSLPDLDQLLCGARADLECVARWIMPFVGFCKMIHISYSLAHLPHKCGFDLRKALGPGERKCHHINESAMNIQHVSAANMLLFHANEQTVSTKIAALKGGPVTETLEIMDNAFHLTTTYQHRLHQPRIITATAMLQNEQQQIMQFLSAVINKVDSRRMYILSCSAIERIIYVHFEANPHSQWFYEWERSGVRTRSEFEIDGSIIRCEIYKTKQDHGDRADYVLVVRNVALYSSTGFILGRIGFLMNPKFCRLLHSKSVLIFKRMARGWGHLRIRFETDQNLTQVNKMMAEFKIVQCKEESILSLPRVNRENPVLSATNTIAKLFAMFYQAKKREFLPHPAPHPSMQQQHHEEKYNHQKQHHRSPAIGFKNHSHQQYPHHPMNYKYHHNGYFDVNSHNQYQQHGSHLANEAMRRGEGYAINNQQAMPSLNQFGGRYKQQQHPQQQQHQYNANNVRNNDNGENKENYHVKRQVYHASSFDVRREQQKHYHVDPQSQPDHKYFQQRGPTLSVGHHHDDEYEQKQKHITASKRQQPPIQPPYDYHRSQPKHDTRSKQNHYNDNDQQHQSHRIISSSHHARSVQEPHTLEGFTCFMDPCNEFFETMEEFQKHLDTHLDEQDKKAKEKQEKKLRKKAEKEKKLQKEREQLYGIPAFHPKDVEIKEALHGGVICKVTRANVKDKSGFVSKRFVYGASHAHEVSVGFASWGQARKTMVNEVTLMKKLQHHNIIKLVGIIFDPKTHYYSIITPEYCGNVAATFFKGSKSEIGYNEEKKVIQGIAAGLNYIHGSNVIHRDLKAANVLLQRDYTPAVCDFGFSRSHHSSIAASMSVRGTPLYHAPEILLACGTITHYSKSADVYAFATLIWEIKSRKHSYHTWEKKYGSWANALVKIKQEGARLSFTRKSGRSVFKHEKDKEFWINLINAMWCQDAETRPKMDTVLSFVSSLCQNIKNI